jgi:hypothetical protein
MLVASHLANYKAWKALRGGGQSVATIHDLSPVIPASDSPADARRPRSLVTSRSAAGTGWCATGYCSCRPCPPARARADHRYRLRRRVRRHGLLVLQNDQRRREPVARLASRGHARPLPARSPLGYVPWSEGLRLVLDQLHAELPCKPADHQRVRHRHRGRHRAVPVYRRGCRDRGRCPDTRDRPAWLLPLDRYR